MADESRDRYLAELDELLPVPSARRAEIIEELRTHLDDAVADAIERGLPTDRAEADAEARLGAPAQLARELVRPEQSTWRLLAAAGAGVRAGVGMWVYGYLFALLLILVGFVLSAVLVQLTARLFSVNISIAIDGGWNSALTAGAIAVGLYCAGRAATDAVSVASRRLRAQVRPWVVGVGTLTAAAILLLVADLPQNWPSVIALSIAPLAVAVGSYRPNLVPRRFAVPWPVIVALLLLIPLGLLASAVGNGAGSATQASPQPNWEVVGQRWNPGAANQIGSSGWSSDGRAVTATWELGTPAAIAGLRDLRIEAWRADPDEIGRLDTRWNEPFAVAAAQRDGTTITGTVVTTNEPSVSGWTLFLTGIGPDGLRYIVAGGDGGNSTFTGSVWDWVVAVAADR